MKQQRKTFSLSARVANKSTRIMISWTLSQRIRWTVLRHNKQAPVFESCAGTELLSGTQVLHNGVFTSVSCMLLVICFKVVDGKLKLVYYKLKFFSPNCRSLSENWCHTSKKNCKSSHGHLQVAFKAKFQFLKLRILFSTGFTAWTFNVSAYSN